MVVNVVTTIQDAYGMMGITPAVMLPLLHPSMGNVIPLS
jgi:hypothetical protein